MQQQQKKSCQNVAAHDVQLFLAKKANTWEISVQWKKEGVKTHTHTHTHRSPITGKM